MTNSEIVYLTNDNWNDYFEYRTMYQMYYKNQHIGGVRIGRIGQTEDRPDIPDEFETLPTDYFSLGVSLEYYKNLKRVRLFFGAGGAVAAVFGDLYCKLVYPGVLCVL